MSDEAGEVIRLAERRARIVQPSGGDYDVDDLNGEFAVVLIGQKCLVLHEDHDAPASDRVRLLTVQAFRDWTANRVFYLEDARGNLKPHPKSRLWLADPKRREYRGLVFEPGDDSDAAPAFNLWQGFDVAPDPSGDPGPWVDHVFENVCGESLELFEWVVGWFAHMIQRPRERLATALALRGGQGTGKTIVGRLVGGLLDAHYLLVDDPRYLLGQFNAYLAQTLLLQADEAFWSGDKAQIGKLKGLISSDVQMIEHKGVDPIKVRNYVRLMVTSNEDWVVPAGRDERRWCVIDVKDNRAQDADYFGRLVDHFRSDKHRGGLLHYLQTWRLDGTDLRAIPRTAGLFEQKVRSFDPVEAWWFERLQEGAQLPGDAWREEVARHRLVAAYSTEAERVGIRRRGTQTELGIALKRLVPGLTTAQRMGEDDEGRWRRLRFYVFPPLETCRRWFEAAVGQSVEWEAVPEDVGPPTGMGDVED